MASLRDIEKLWRESGVEPPSKLLARIRGQLYLVITDYGSILRVMDQFNQIYAVSKSACKEKSNMYICGDVPLKINQSTNRDKIAQENIVPYVFSGFLAV